MAIRNTLGRTIILSGEDGEQIILRPGAITSRAPVETVVFAALIEAGKLVVQDDDAPDEPPKPKRGRRKAE